MIACTRCSKENQDHYKFCLGCGAELPRDAAAKAAPAKPATPPSGFHTKEDFKAPAKGDAPKAEPVAAEGKKKAAAVPSFGGAPAKNAPPPSAAKPAPAAAAATSGDSVTCEKCSKVNPTSFKFCGACGNNLLEQRGQTPPPSPEPAAPTATSAQAPRGSLVVIRPDGTEGESVPLGSGTTKVGRNAGGVFANDAYLSPDHATFTFDGDSLSVTDNGSLNGVYWRIEPEAPVTLDDGTVFRIGQEIVRFSHLAAPKSAKGVDVMGSPNPGFLGRIALITGRDSTGNAYCIPADGFHLGRERGDIIFPDDGYVSGLHCRIHREGSKVAITDVGSSNGTFVRVKGKLKLTSGMLVLMGQQLFRVEY
ncbi:MAG: FHA domain-containing protein [Polyangiales bacterium]|nr:FHA domain-containing protein [Myxococcales bacterium]